LTETGGALDDYILAELDELTGVAGGALDDYKPDIAIAAFVRFLDILNNWYIRLNRERFWNEDQTAFNILFFVLKEFCKLLAPFAPFISDYIFRNLTGAESVHLAEFPKSMNIKNVVMQDMRKVQSIVSIGKQLREKYGLRNRLPLSSLEIAGWNDSKFDEIIRDELNIKEIRHSENVLDVADSFVYLITPKIGARLGPALKEIIPAVKNDGMAAVKKYELQPDEYELRLNVKDGVAGAALPDNTAVVVIDTNITPELATEGLANDALRFIQDTRKTIGLDVSDRIVLSVAGDSEIIAAIKMFEPNIAQDVLATEIKYANSELEHTAAIEGHEFSIAIAK
jgi:isoleucyl-tRNA synthetase